MNRLLTIEPGDAVEHGMPPVRISMDLTDLPLTYYTFADPLTYVSLSGPPGGPLFFIIKTIPQSIRDLDGLEYHLNEHYKSANRPLPAFGPRGEVSIQGTSFPALLYFTGKMAAASASCALVIQPPASNASAPGLLLIFGHGGNPESISSCAEIAGCEPLAKVLETLKWDLAIDPSDRKKTPPPTPVQPVAALSVGVASAKKQVEEETLEPAPAPQRRVPASATPVALLKWVGEMKDKLKGMGCWSDITPTAEDYKKWTQLQMQMWSMQSTIQAMERSLQQAVECSPNEPVYGVIDGLKNWSRMLVTPETAALKALLDRGPV